MLPENGGGSVFAMNSSLQSSCSFVYANGTSDDGKLKSPSPSSTGNGINTIKLGYQSAEALVEDGIKHACQQLTMKLSDIHMASRRAAEAATRRSDVAAWLNSMFGSLNLPAEPSEEDLRACLYDGIILCSVMNKLNPGSVQKIVSKSGPESPEAAPRSAFQRFENVRNFLVAVDDLRLPTFEASDLEQGSMVTVVDCLLSLKEYYDWKHGVEVHSLWKQGDDISTPNEMNSMVRGPPPGKPVNNSSKNGSQPRKRWILPDIDNCSASDFQHCDQSPGLNGQKIGKLPLRPADCRTNSVLDSTFDAESLLTCPVMSDSTSAWIHHIGQKFREVLQVKAMRYPDLHAVESAGMLKYLDNAPSQSLLNLVCAILGDKQSEEVPSLVEFMLRKVMEEFERRLLTQGEQTKKLKHALREVLARQDKIVSRANVLEALAAGTGEEIKLLTDQLQKIKMEKMQVEDEIKAKEQYVIQLLKEREESDAAVQILKEESEVQKKLEEEHVQQLEMQKKEVESELQEKLREMEDLVAYSKSKTEELEALSALEMQKLKLKDFSYQTFLSCQLQAFQELKKVSQVTKEEVIKVQKNWQIELANLEEQLKGLASAAAGYHKVLAENRQLYNEVQDLKGNIRVYCRVRPFLSGQTGKQSTVDYIGENGDLLIVNPNKQGKDAHRMFNFNKVFGPSASQEEVFLDTRPLIRSVLDGYNVCIFAYGQTGSGKTFTMSGPNSSSSEDWGVNYRALNDLFEISQKRKDLFKYEVGVQMIEIYNEQVRDLLTSDGSQKRLGIRSISQPNGLSVPEASMLPVESTADVLDLMKIGQRNRAVGATALNERSSRSHSVLTVHVQGTDFASGAILRGCLHLVDLAGSERVDRSEVTGDRLREAQHINKSLSALGDVISALANKSAHVPYRNSKLTQILQDSLGGQAKTLMFVQLNPDAESYSETVSTLKFAERVSGVELGAARSNKESKDVRELKEQIIMLKDVVAKKEIEIERLQTLRESRNHAEDIYFNNEKLKMRSTNSSVNLYKSPASGQVHRSQRLTTEGPGSIEGHQSLTGQALKCPLRPSTRENTSQDFEATSSGGSDNMSASQDEINTSGSTNVEKMDGAAGLLVVNLREVSDADNGSEHSDKHSDIGSQETSMQSQENLKCKDHCSFLNQDTKIVSSSYSSLESRQDISPDIDLLGLKGGDLDERLSEISDGDLSMGTETDGSISSIVELTLFPQRKESGKLIPDLDKRLMTPSRIPRPPIRSDRQTLVHPHTRLARHLRNVQGTDHSSSRRPNILSTKSTGTVDSPQRRVAHRQNVVATPQRRVSHRQPSSNQLAGSSTPSKRWQ